MCIFICKCKYTIYLSQLKGRSRYRCGIRVGCREGVPLELLRVSSYVFIKHAYYRGVCRITTKSKQLFRLLWFREYCQRVPDEFFFFETGALSHQNVFVFTLFKGVMSVVVCYAIPPCPKCNVRTIHDRSVILFQIYQYVEFKNVELRFSGDLRFENKLNKLKHIINAYSAACMRGAGNLFN